jgi:hypothetical protein
LTFSSLISADFEVGARDPLKRTNANVEHIQFIVGHALVETTEHYPRGIERFGTHRFGPPDRPPDPATTVCDRLEPIPSLHWKRSHRPLRDSVAVMESILPAWLYHGPLCRPIVTDCALGRLSQIRAHVETHALPSLQEADDFEEVVGPRIACRPNIRIKLFDGM